MAEQVPDDFSREFEALYADPTILPVHSTRFRLWCLMAAVQLASRHPEAIRTAPIQVAVEMARRIQAMVATTPALARVAEQGWDQTLDFTTASPECRWCGRRTSHPADIANRYCPCCGGAYPPRGCEHRGADQVALHPWDEVPS